MDHLNTSLMFKIRKVVRYTFIYGISRTFIKVQGQLHQRRKYSAYPERHFPSTSDQCVALVGCGNFCFSNIAYFLRKQFGTVFAACMDRDADKAYSLSGYYRIPQWTTRFEDILENPKVKLVYIASNHASHAEYAIQALEAGKHVYIEKPHVVNFDQLHRLVEAFQSSSGKVFVGFNRPYSRFGKIMLDSLAKESGPGMYNWSVIGHPIAADHWYMRAEEGGRVLGNLCHWMDFLFKMADSKVFPITITPTRAGLNEHDMVVNYTFGDGTIGVIAFSAKGETFEGVRERLCAHRGQCIIFLDDYKSMSIETGDKKKSYRNTHRDLGHAQGICAAYQNVIVGEPYSRQAMLEYFANTGWLFLKTKEAFDLKRPVTIEAYPLQVPSAEYAMTHEAS